jgi:pilus assembly protein Flp/PilA
MMNSNRFRQSDFCRAYAGLIHDETGATAIEYSLIASGIALAIITTVALVGESVSAMFLQVAGGFK